MNLIAVNPDRELVEEHLDRILASVEFRGAERPSRLLRHLVHQTLAGRGALLKEFSLAIDVLGRDDSFDPRSDAIVRVEVSRLRSRLKKYYQSTGRTDELAIDIPPGVYQPTFRKVYLSAEAPADPPAAAKSDKLTWWVPALGMGLLVAGVFALSATRPETPARHAQMVRITGEGGRSESPAGSRKTETLVYASDRGGSNLNVWVQALGGGDPRQLTTDAADDYDPDLSPDGRLVAFQSDREQPGVYLRPVTDGGTEKLIAARGNRPRFSPDGRHLAYWTGAGPYGNLLLAGQTRIDVVDVHSGVSTRLAPSFASALHPIWSPDGKRVLFWGRKERGETADWWIAGLDGSQPRNTNALQAIRAEGLERPPWFHLMIGPDRWMANGDVLFSASEGESTNIWSIRIAGSAAVPGQLRRVTGGANLDLFANPIDDRFIAYTVVTRTVDLWSIPADTNQGVTKGAPKRLTDDATWETFPSVALDGTSLLYGRKSSAARTPQLLNASGGITGSLRQDGTHQFDGAIPVLASNGGSSVFMIAESGELASYLVDPVSGKNRRICEGCRTWIVDGKRAIFSPSKQPWSLVQLDLETGKQCLFLKASNAMLRFPSISPDGRSIAVEHVRPEGVQIVIAPNNPDAPVDEAQWTTVTGIPDSVSRPRFSPNGRLLYFVSMVDGHRCIWARHIANGKPAGDSFAVAHFHTAQLSLSNLMSPDFNLSVAADKLVFNSAQVKSNIWLFDTASQRDSDALRAGLRLHP